MLYLNLGVFHMLTLASKGAYALGAVLVVFNLSGCNDDSDGSTSSDGVPTPSGVDISTAMSVATVVVTEQPKLASSTISISSYGVKTPIDFYMNADDSIDIFWQDTGDADSSWNITTHTSYLDPSITTTVVIPSAVDQSGRFLGFSKKEASATFYLAYGADNQFAETDSDGICSGNNCEGEYWLSGFDKDGVSAFDTSIFGGDLDLDLSAESASGSTTKGDPGQASVGVVLYDATTDKIITYTGHEQRWDDDIRHQAGWIGSFTSDGVESDLFNGWFSSHNFDQRLMLAEDGSLFSLAHGDAYPRALGLAKWNISSGTLVYNEEYYEIENGVVGNNSTLTDTGDLTELENGSIAIAFATEDERNSRDVVLQINSGVDGTTADDIEDTDIWLTAYDDSRLAGKGIKVVALGGNNILVAWNTYQGESPDEGATYGDYVNTTISVYDLQGAELGSMTIDDRLMPTQSMQVSNDGMSVVWVTASENSELIINTIAIDDLPL